MRLSVIGCGYLGTVHAAAMASLGHEVIGIDTDAERIDTLRRGEAPFFEPEVEGLLSAGIKSGLLSFDTRLSAAREADVHFICVGTPQRLDEDAADLSALHAVCEDLLPFLRPGAVVAGKSTVPVGTAEPLRQTIATVGATLVWNPEFLREGHAVADTLSPDRIVIGASTDAAGVAAVELLREVYTTAREAGTPVVVTDLATAELVKGAANAFLATRLSFMNAIAEVADATGADVSLLSEALGYDDRIGPKYLGAGIGFGGGCLPKDIRSFASRARELGATSSAELLEHVDAINLGQRTRTVETAARMLGGTLTNRRITVLGAAFKPNSDDVRDSPALDIAHALHSAGATVTVTDPAALKNASLRYPELHFEYDLDAALAGAELVLLATEWQEYRALDPAIAGAGINEKRVLDGRNCLNPVAWTAAGWTYRGVGRR